MRKLLISILIILLLLITIYSVVKGLSIGNIKILSFNNIKAESTNIDVEIAEITKMKEQNYKKAISDIEDTAKSLLKEKESYATLVSTSTESELQKATHMQKYEQDFLWAKIGNHATAQGVELKLDIAVGSVNEENYDLYFEIIGSYTNITEFVIAIENDNLLGFKIENFKIIDEKAEEPANENTTTIEYNTGRLIATFAVTDISINIDKTKLENKETEENNANQNVTTDKTNTTENTNTNTKDTSKKKTNTTNNKVTEGVVSQ